MPDADLLRAAIDAATDGNQSAFARLLGHRDGSQVRAWLSGRRPLPEAVRMRCRLIVDHPRIAREMALTDRR